MTAKDDAYMLSALVIILLGYPVMFMIFTELTPWMLLGVVDTEGFVSIGQKVLIMFAICALSFILMLLGDYVDSSGLN